MAHDNVKTMHGEERVGKNPFLGNYYKQNTLSTLTVVVYNA